jgi:hypothetical protein
MAILKLMVAIWAMNMLKLTPIIGLKLFFIYFRYNAK